MQHMKTDLGMRIEDTLERIGMSPRAASIAASLHPDTLGKVISGKTKSLRGDNAKAVAGVLGVSVFWLLSGQEEDVDPAEDPGYGEPYGGILEAGPFRPVDLLDQDEHRRIPISRDTRYPKGQFVAYEVRGDSMNLENIVEGMWVLAMNIEDWKTWYGGLRDGMLVVVQASRHGGQEIERTVKQLQIFPDRMVLVPKSSNSRHRPVDYLKKDDPDNGEKIEIIGVVTKAERLYGLS